MFDALERSSIDVSYSSGYRFSDMFACAALIDQGVGRLAGGAVIVLVLGRLKLDETATQ